jgi:hypothetical protein
MESAHRYDEAKSPQPVPETVFIRKSDVSFACAKPDATSTNEKFGIPELAGGAVVVSTYDGKWTPEVESK